MSISFGGRLVVVTGGSGALGVAVVEGLLRAGARVRVPILNENELSRLPKAPEGYVQTSLGVDLTDIAAVDAFYGSGEGLYASIHVAGGFGMGPIESDDQPGLFERMMAMNARTSFLCCRRASAILRAAGGGRIVNVSAKSGVNPEQGAQMTAYTMSKAAVAALTLSLAAEVKPHGVWVNAVAPSIIDTPANRAALPDADHSKWPKVEELAQTIVFLASPDNAVITGGVIPVCGRT